MSILVSAGVVLCAVVVLAFVRFSRPVGPTARRQLYKLALGNEEAERIAGLALTSRWLPVYQWRLAMRAVASVISRQAFEIAIYGRRSDV
ncbi:hypothetical protein ACVNIS_07235 [Sphaerotilaceae bacterium SBD11-9]